MESQLKVHRKFAHLTVCLAGCLLFNNFIFAQGRCQKIQAIVATLPACVETPNGAALSLDIQQAKELASFAAQGEDRFTRYFGRPAPPYVVLQGDTSSDARTSLRNAGFKIVRPWLPATEYTNSLEDSVRRQVDAKASSLGWSAAQTAAAQLSAQEQIRRATGKTGSKRDPAALPHELGHGWYVETYWPEFKMGETAHYGGPGPDWLDEGAAILMEDDKSKEQRRELFRTTRASGKDMDALEVFLNRTHPMQSNGMKPTGGVAGQMSIKVVKDDDPAFRAYTNVAVFYAECLVFTDFLADISGDAQIMGKVGEAFSHNVSFETWLSTQGAGNHLPRSVQALDSAWHQWMTTKYGEIVPVSSSAGEK